MLIEDLAIFLQTWDLGKYDPEGIEGDIFVGVLPTNYDNCISIFDTGGQSSELPHDHIRSVQVIVRNKSYGQSNAKAWEVYRAVRFATLLNGRRIICRARDIPRFIGEDSDRRQEFTLNFEMWSKGDE
jgi:hypothetical protein